MPTSKLNYSAVGDDYSTKDPIKIMAQTAAKSTAQHLHTARYPEVSETRGESAFVWKQGSSYMASVIEGLGTKNLIADAMRKVTKKTYYDVIAHDTVATIINDLVTTGAKPLVIHAYWAIEHNNWLADTQRMKDLIRGWKSACDITQVTWGGGETPTLQGVLLPNTIELGGSAVGVIKNTKHLLSDKKLRNDDRILLLKSTGINANGVSLARAVAAQLPQGYATLMKNGQRYGEGLLVKSNIYATLIQDLLQKDIDIHYISHITGHGMRKIMRSNRAFTYVIKEMFEPQEVFCFIQQHAKLSEKEMYETYNMGMDYAIFLPKDQVLSAKKLIKKQGYDCIEAGYITKGKRQVILESRNIIFESESLAVKS